MSSGEKILSVIRTDSEQNIAQMQAENKAKCEAILNRARQQAEKIRSRAEQKKTEQTTRLKKSCQSRRELEKRNMILRAKRAAINDAIADILDYMEHLDDKEYFELIYRLAATLAVKEGEVLLNAKDLGRVPADFIQQLRKKSGIRATLCTVPYDGIDSGFVLRNGDIEENMSFSALLAERREAVEDIVNRELFKD